MSSCWTSLATACLGAFGEAVTFTPAGGPAEPVQGIVSPPNRHSDEWPGQYLGVEFKIADLSRMPTRGDTVAIGAVTYNVFDVGEIPFMSTVRVTLEKT